MFLYTPTDDISHYRISIIIFVPEQKDGRGRSKHKTLQLVNAIEQVTKRQLVSTLWGEPAYWAKIVQPKIERSIQHVYHTLRFSVAAPLRFGKAELASDLQACWDKAFGKNFMTYVECRRHYTSDEILEHCW